MEKEGSTEPKARVIGNVLDECLGPEHEPLASSATAQAKAHTGTKVLPCAPAASAIPPPLTTQLHHGPAATRSLSGVPRGDVRWYLSTGSLCLDGSHVPPVQGDPNGSLRAQASVQPTPRTPQQHHPTPHLQS